jgi:DNA-binding response OmpR family regulator
MLVRIHTEEFERDPERVIRWTQWGHHVLISATDSPGNFRFVSSTPALSDAALEASAMPSPATAPPQGLLLHCLTRRVFYNTTWVRLTSREWLLLCHLIDSRGRVVTRDTLISVLSPWEHGPCSNTVDVHVRALRRKLPELPLLTVRGTGYMFAH